MSVKPILCGLDLGSKTCGIAVSDGLGMLAHPVTTLRFSHEDYKACLELLAPIVSQYQVAQFVLGFPKSLNNAISKRAQVSEMFKASLEKAFGLPVQLVDERFTTVFSTKNLISLNKKRKERKEIIDQAAAVAILQSYLDQLKFKNGE